MNRTTLRMCFIACFAGTMLLSGSLTSAGAVERTLLGIHIYSNVKAILRRFGNPSYVLTAGQTFNAESNSVTASTLSSSAGMGSLPPMQPAAGPVPAFGQAQLPQDQDNSSTPPAPAAGEVTLVYEKPNGVTYQFLLSTSGSVVQITALGYSDPIARTTRGVVFGTSYTQVINRYGYPENQSVTNGVTVVDYSKRSHVAFELVDNAVVGIVVAAID